MRALNLVSEVQMFFLPKILPIYVQIKRCFRKDNIIRLPV